MAEIPDTPAIRMLKAYEVSFVPHFFAYAEKGGTSVSSKALGVSEHTVVKTLIMLADRKDPLVVLMHGDRKVDTRRLAEHLAVKKVAPAPPEEAEKLSGYLVGGTSPFGVKTPMPVYLEKSVLDIETIHINGGQRGFLVAMRSTELIRILKPTLVTVAV